MECNISKKICIIAVNSEQISSQSEFINSLMSKHSDLTFLVPASLEDQIDTTGKILSIEDLSRNIPYYLEFNCNSKAHYLSFLIYEALNNIGEVFDSVIFLSDQVSANTTLQAKKALGKFINTNILVLNPTFNKDMEFEPLQREISLKDFADKNADNELLDNNKQYFTFYKELKQPPNLSIIIPFYNTGKYIKETLLSIEQNAYPNLEIIIINDGSTDEYSLQILSELEKSGKYIVLHQENKGPAAARNIGISRSTGEYIFLFDSDDTISNDYIEKCINCLINNPDYSYVNTQNNMVSEDNLDFLHYHFTYINHPNTIALGYNLLPAIFRRDVFDNISFDESLIRHEDWDFYINITKNGHKGLTIPEFLYNYRKRWNSLMNTFSAEDREKCRKYVYEKHRAFFDELDINIMDIKPWTLDIAKIFDNSAFHEKIIKFVLENKGKKACFYGAGQIAEKLIELVDLSGLDILGFIDGNPSKKGQKIGNYMIHSLDDIKELSPDVLVLTVAQKEFVMPYIENFKAKNNLSYELIFDLIL